MSKNKKTTQTTTATFVLDNGTYKAFIEVFEAWTKFQTSVEGSVHVRFYKTTPRRSEVIAVWNKDIKDYETERIYLDDKLTLLREDRIKGWNSRFVMLGKLKDILDEYAKAYALEPFEIPQEIVTGLIIVPQEQEA